MATIDERKIEEIVAKVLERLGGGASDGATAKAPALTTSHVPQSEQRTANVPRGTNGVYAGSPTRRRRRRARRSSRTSAPPVGTRVKMVEAMRKAVLANNDALSRYAVEETGLGRYEDKLNKNRLVAEKTPGCEILRPQSRTPATTA